MEITGHCLCGAITYRCDAEPVLTGVCHCTDCQRQTGTASSVVVAVPAGSLKVAGEMASFTTVGDVHGTETNRFFCSNCGSPIVSRIVARPDLEFIKAGTLDDTSWLRPTVEFFGRSAQAWEPEVPGATRLDTTRS
ncbi:MAG: GFA family protein [Thermoleophilia bacterium]